MQNFDISKITHNVLNKPAIISSNIFSYKKYIVGIKQSVKKLSEISFKRGERVAIFAERDESFPIIFMAMLYSGIITIPINKSFPKNQIITMLSSINCNKLFVSDITKNEAFDSNIEVIQINKFLSENISEYQSFNLKPLALEQGSTIIFTSGSSGNQKAVMHTFGNHYYSALGSNENIPFKPGDRWLLSLPLYHVGGLSILFRALLSGGAVVIPDKNLELTENIEKYSITHVSLVATQLIRLFENKDSIKILKNLKSILVGGSNIPSNLIKNSLKYNLPIYTTYGSTEMASQIATTKSNEKPEKLYTAGKLLNYTSIKISEDQEILVKGKTLFKGYVEHEKINKPFDSKGWFHTGDLGQLDKEEYLSVIGRKDNMFISGGENIYPEEIEKILTSINDIKNAVVIDIPDKEFGARPIAFIKYHSNTKFDKENIKKSLSNHLPKFKIPDAFYIWPQHISDFKPNRFEFKNYYTKTKLKGIE